MKKILIIFITIVFLAIIAFAGWYFILRDPNVPVVETIKDILPFGEGSNAPLTTNPSTSFDSTQDKPLGNSNLFRISAEPVAGAVILNKNASTAIVRYVDRATGHIYDVNLTTLIKTKVSNQTLPKIYEAYFRPDGNVVLLRFLKDDSDTVENISLTLTPPVMPTTLYTITSASLRGNIGAVAVGTGNTLIYTLKDTSSIVSSAFNGTGEKTLLASPFKDWRLAIAGSALLAYPKASATASGVVYTLGISGGGLTKVLGPLSGLTAIPGPTGNRILYSYVENGEIRLFAKNLANKTETEILPTTLAEKCIWSVKKIGIVFCASPADEPEARDLDTWYRGLTHFSDRLWQFDTNQDIAQVLVEPESTLNISIDAVDLKLSPNENYLVFINKIDLSLWGLKIEPF